MKRVLLLAMVLFLLPASVWATVYYVAPAALGTGTCASAGNACTMATALAKPPVAGDTIWMTDGTYTGSAGMLTPATTISGSAGSYISVKAVNDGAVLIDGQNARVPANLASHNSYWDVEGINFANSNGFAVVNIQTYSTNNIFRRCVAWNASEDINSDVWVVYDHSTNNLLEDVAGFGSARKAFQIYGVDNNTVRRAFGQFTEWNKNNLATSNPNGVFSTTYEGHYNICENCIGMYAEDGNSHLFDPIANLVISRLHYDANKCGNDKILGSIGFHLSSNTAYLTSQLTAPGDGAGTDAAAEYDCMTIDNFVAYSGSSGDLCTVDLQNPLDPYGNTLVLNHLTDIGTTTACNGARGFIDTKWAAGTTNRSSGNTVSDVPNIWNGAGTSGARICYRYQDGVLTSNPLWPWPMNQRIIDAMTAASLTPVDLTATLQTVFGTIPGACLSNPPPYLPQVVTNAVTSITATGGTGSGTWQAGVSISDCGVAWSTSPHPTISGSHASYTAGSCTGTFTAPITGATQGVTLYTAAYETNPTGTAYGNDSTFIPTGSFGSGDWTQVGSGYNTITVDGTPAFVSAGGVSTNTISYTVAANSNPIINVDAGDPDRTISATYNGTALTQLGQDGWSGVIQGGLFGWPASTAAPSAGAHNFVVTVAGGTVTDLNVSVASFLNVANAAPYGTASTVKNGSSAPSTSVASDTNHLVISGVVGAWSATPTVTDGHQTPIGAGHVDASSALGYQTGAATTTASWNIGDTGRLSVLTEVALNPTSATTPNWYVGQGVAPTSVYDNTSSVWLTLVGSLGAMSANTCFYDSGASRLYCQVTGGGNPGTVTVYTYTVNAPTLGTPVDGATGVGVVGYYLTWTNNNTSPPATTNYIRVKKFGGSYVNYSVSGTATSVYFDDAYNPPAGTTQYCWSVQAQVAGDSSVFPTDQCFTTGPATYYVDQVNGNDNNDGFQTTTTTNNHGPWKTIATVNASTFSPGDNLYLVGGGSWAENVTFPSSGTAGNLITTGMYGTGAWPIVQAFNGNSKNYLSISKIKTTGLMTLSGTNNIANYVWPSNGLTVSGASASVNYCLVQGAALTVSAGATSTIVENCSVYNVGIAANETFTLKNTIVYPAGSNITIAVGKTVSGTSNLFGDSGKGGSGTYTNVGGTLWSSNPQWTNAAGGIFTLLPISPAINAGVNICTGTDTPLKGCTGVGTGSYYDYAGVQVPLAGRYSIGAYQGPLSGGDGGLLELFSLLREWTK